MPARIPWRELLAFLDASGPLSRVTAVIAPAQYGWTVEAVVIARGLGVPLPWEKGAGRRAGATARRTTATETETKRIGTPMSRDDLDGWFLPAQ